MSVAKASPTNRYAAELCRIKSGGRLLPVFQPSCDPLKEVSESFGAYHAVTDHLDFDLRDPGVTVICVGDGRTPRTGATFALRSSWNVFSVDPQLGRPWHWERRIKRLHCDPRRIEEVTIECETAVIVAVHSHAGLAESVRAVKAKRIAVVAMPCCVELVLGTFPDVEYDDLDIISPRRTIKIWRDVA